MPERRIPRLLRLTWRNRRSLLAWDLASAAAITVVAVVWIESRTLDKHLGVLLLGEVGLAAALVGTVVAGFAIITAFLSPEFVAVLRETRAGVHGDFWPFWFVTALAAWTVVLSAGGLLVSAQCPSGRPWVFAVTTFMSTYTLFAVINLVGHIAAQAENRLRLIAAGSSKTAHDVHKPSEEA